MRRLVLALLLALPSVGGAQSAETLADIRQQLAMLYSETQRLRGELNTTGLPQNSVGGATAIDRLNAIEFELQRLTALTEELEFRINRVTVDATNRIGDLEFRLCEVTPGCDLGSIGDTPTLGGVDVEATIPTPQPAEGEGGPALALSERADFERAQEALAQGDFRGAADLFAAFVQTYPNGPLNAEAHLLRGEAMESLGDMSGAARAYLESFSTAPDGGVAPDALLKLGTALAALGQTQDACVTLGEVLVRFPSAPATIETRTAMQNLGCS